MKLFSLPYKTRSSNIKSFNILTRETHLDTPKDIPTKREDDTSLLVAISLGVSKWVSRVSMLKDLIFDERVVYGKEKSPGHVQDTYLPPCKSSRPSVHRRQDIPDKNRPADKNRRRYTKIKMKYIYVKHTHKFSSVSVVIGLLHQQKKVSFTKIVKFW